MITYDNAWHDRMGNAAEILASDHTIDKRLKFYIRGIMSNPNSASAPYANAIGILVNRLGFNEEEALHHIQNEITLASNRNINRRISPMLGATVAGYSAGEVEVSRGKVTKVADDHVSIHWTKRVDTPEFQDIPSDFFRIWYNTNKAGVKLGIHVEDHN
jgi:hypothetical protein